MNHPDTAAQDHGHGHAGGYDAPPGAPAAEAVKDAVCGMNVNPGTARHRHAHEGKDYFFCCNGCREKFAADPARYLGASPAPAPQPVAAAPAGGKIEYTCPMHPEII